MIDLWRLAQAMHDSDTWPPHPKTKEPHVWANCNDEHRMRYHALAERYGTAYKAVAHA